MDEVNEAIQSEKVQNTQPIERFALTVEEMAASLGIGIVRAYQLTNREGFPVIQLGGERGKKMIPVNALQMWLLKQVGMEETA